MKKVFIILSVLFLNELIFAQQDPHYSHYMFNQASYNPAFAGSSGQINAVVLNRQQWFGLEGAPQTTLLTVDAPFKIFGINSGAALDIYDDRLGFEKNFSAKLAYAYLKNLGAGNLAIGVSAGMFNKSINGEWKFPDQQEQLFSSSEARKIIFDMAVGVYYSLENFYLGISSTHIHQPRFEFIGGGEIFLKRHYFLTGAYNIQLANALIDLTPSFIVKSDATTTQFDLNINLLYNKKFWGGVTYRNKDAVVFLAGTSVFSNIRIGMAYELSLSSIRKANVGSFEVLIGYSFMLGGGPPPRTYRSVRFL